MKENANAVGIVGSVDPIGIVGSVDPIGIVPDLSSVPSGAPFGLTLTLRTPPISPIMVGVYILPAVVGSAPAPIMGSAPAPIMGSAPAPIMGSAPAPIAGSEDVSIHFSNLDIRVHSSPPVAASPMNNPMHFVVTLFSPQQQQQLHLPAPIVTTPSQYIVIVVGHNQNNIPTNGVSTTITVHP